MTTIPLSPRRKTFADLNLPAIALAAAVTLVLSAVYYIVLGGVWASLRGLDAVTASPPGFGEIVGQYIRNAVVAVALAYLMKRTEAATMSSALGLAAVVWLGFQAMAIAGSVLHEQYPLGLYVLHAGDALMTTVVMTLILHTWRRRRQRS